MERRTEGQPRLSHLSGDLRTPDEWGNAPCDPEGHQIIDGPFGPHRGALGPRLFLPSNYRQQLLRGINVGAALDENYVELQQADAVSEDSEPPDHLLPE